MNQVPILLLLLVLSGFFSGAEIALFSLGPEKVQALKNNAKTARDKKRIAKLEAIKADPDKLLVTILIGCNLVNVAASSIATVIALGIAQNLGAGEDTSTVIGIVTGVMTLLMLIFSETIPKSLCHRYALRFSVLAAPILRFLQIVFFPVVWPLAKLTASFSGSNEPRHGLTEDELKAALELSEREGRIESDERELVQNILEFDEHSVETVMTPRSKIFGIADNTAVLDALPLIADANFSRIPIFHDTIDDVVGVLKVQHLVEEFLKKDFKKKNMANLPLLAPIKIPLTTKIDALLRQFQDEQSHMALVYDEHGGLIGLITLEDIIEEIFGEFEDESDEVDQLVRRSGKNKFSCDASIELEQIEKFVKKQLGHAPDKHWPWTLEEENKSLAYFLLERLEHLPARGEKLVITEDGHRFTFIVKKIDGERIAQVDVSIA